MVMLKMYKGKKRMVHIMQNQQVRNGAENVIVSHFTDEEFGFQTELNWSEQMAYSA